MEVASKMTTDNDRLLYETNSSIQNPSSEASSEKDTVEQNEKDIKINHEELNKRQLESQEKQKSKEQEKAIKRLQKEQEKSRREEEKKRREEERKRKADQREKEKELKRIRIQQEKDEKERKREEERIKKQAEREEKERQRLEKKRRIEEMKEKKEQEKRRAEEEKKKAEELKSKSQMKISSFFTVGNLNPNFAGNKEHSGNANCDFPMSDKESPYDKLFLPFFRKKNVIMAPKRFSNKEEFKATMKDFESLLSNPSLSTDESSRSFFMRAQLKSKSQRNLCTTPLEIMNRLDSSKSTETQIYELLQKLGPIKYLQFYENTKPPYVGTWCSILHSSVKIPMANPFDTSNPTVNYDYDSDLDWNGEDAEEEGEDIDAEEDEDEDEEVEEDDDMDDFVESNDQNKAKLIMGRLVPICKWKDDFNKPFFDDFKYHKLSSTIEFPIDPFKNYWDCDKLKEAIHNSSKHSTDPSRDLKNNACSTSTEFSMQNNRKPMINDLKSLLQLMDFVERNNDFTIGTLVELSQKEFKSFTKALLRNTIQNFAFYDKKKGIWTVKSDMKEKLEDNV